MLALAVVIVGVWFNSFLALAAKGSPKSLPVQSVQKVKGVENNVSSSSSGGTVVTFSDNKIPDKETNTPSVKSGSGSRPVLNTIDGICIIIIVAMAFYYYKKRRLIRELIIDVKNRLHSRKNHAIIE